MSQDEEESVAGAAKRSGVSRGALRYRMSVKNMTLEEAIAYSTTMTNRGPRSLTQRAKAANMPKGTLHYRVYVCGMSVEAALRKPVPIRRRPKKRRRPSS